MRLQQVGKRYGPGGAWVLRGVEIDAAGGGAIRVTGGNGSGKSTLLRLVAGVCVPSTGKVLGRPPTGYVPERFPPALPFTVRAYLLRLARVHGLGRARSRARVADCLAAFGIEHVADAALATLSKGTCQKVAVAQAVVAEPKLLVLDEAWTGLDDAARRTLDALVTSRIAAGGIVVFVDHDPHRLGDLPAVRWEVRDTRVVERRTAAPAPHGAVTVIEVEACATVPERLAEVPGVLDVVARAPGSYRLRVARENSDAVLRALLAEAALHVAAVREESAAAGTQAGPPAATFPGVEGAGA